MKTSEYFLIDNQLKLKEDGFVIVKNVFKEIYLNNIRELTDKIIKFSSQNSYDPFEDFYLKHRIDQGVLYDLYQRYPEFQEMVKAPQIVNQLIPVLGKNIYLYVNSLIYKPQGKQNIVPWHQDFLSRPNESTKYIAWIALDNATKNNGCLKVIPKSHTQGFLEWFTIEGETHHDRVKQELIDESKAQFIELNAGDALIFNQFLLHSSDQVDVDIPRRAFRVVYKALDRVEIPRGSPIMISGGLFDSISDECKNTKQSQTKKMTFLKKMAHKLGKKLITL